MYLSPGCRGWVPRCRPLLILWEEEPVLSDGTGASTSQAAPLAAGSSQEGDVAGLLAGPDPLHCPPSRGGTAVRQEPPATHH